jgi:hypothetical protein
MPDTLNPEDRMTLDCRTALEMQGRNSVDHSAGQGLARQDTVATAVSEVPIDCAAVPQGIQHFGTILTAGIPWVRLH